VSRTIAALCAEHRLLQPDGDGIFRVPFLVKGELRVPAPIGAGAIAEAFRALDAQAGPSDSEATHAQIGEVQVLREPIIDRTTLRRTGEYLYSTMPVFDAGELIETDLDALADDLYDLPFERVLDYVDGLREAIVESAQFVDQVRAATVKTAELPDAEHDLAFAAVPLLLGRDSVRQSVDHDLFAWGIPGSRFLDGWQPLPEAAVQGAPVHLIADGIYAQPGGRAFASRTAEIRALPTRQLHITAGNSPHIPFFSALRAIATKSPAVVKSPYGATLPGALLALAAAASAAGHPITRHLSIVYWPGGDETVESRFFAPGAFERIVVWGAPQAVLSVKTRALFAKVLTFDPRYGVTLLGKEAFGAEEGLRALAIRIVADCLVANQKACIASQVIYVESGDPAALRLLAETLQSVLTEFDAAAPNVLRPAQVGELKRLMKGRFLDADWYVNERDGFFTSGVVVVRDEFSITAHPMCRLIVLRPVDDLAAATRYLHPGVSTVSVWPDARRAALRTRIAARGVSNVLPLGHSGSGFAGQPHDGMRVLSELVDWKNG
jgi:hypothetical protein